MLTNMTFNVTFAAHEMTFKMPIKMLITCLFISSVHQSLIDLYSDQARRFTLEVIDLKHIQSSCAAYFSNNRIFFMTLLIAIFEIKHCIFILLGVANLIPIIGPLIACAKHNITILARILTAAHVVCE